MQQPQLSSLSQSHPSQLQYYNFPSASQMAHTLYSKYSSSQTYFYTSKISQIVRERRTQINIVYEDIEYICDQEQYLKRWYSSKEFPSKMFTFKEYYFYHQDCPRIFMSGIEEVYAKWQDKKRDIIYKKLKLLYGEGEENNTSGSQQEEDEDVEQKSNNKKQKIDSHFLFQISQYNPYSKNYYLRVKEKKEKEEAARKQAAKKNLSKFELEEIGHDLSRMLDQMSQISQISTLVDRTPRKNTLYQIQSRRTVSYHTHHGKQGGSSQQLTNSNSNPNSNSTVKFNFKRSKGKGSQLQNVANSNSKAVYKDKKNVSNNGSIEKKKGTLRIQLASKDKDTRITELNLKEAIYRGDSAAMYGIKLSPKFSTNHNYESLKSQSIFSVSSFGVLNRKSELKVNSKRQMLKINFEPNRQQTEARYDSQKPVKVMVKSHSNSKSIASSAMKGSLERIRVREISLGRGKSITGHMPKGLNFQDYGQSHKIVKQNEFSDKKLSIPNHQQNPNRLRSHKSQFSSLSSLKQPLFKIKPNNQREHGLKKTLELKHF